MLLRLFLVLLSVVVTGCGDDENAPKEKGSLAIVFNNYYGNEDLLLNTDYVNPSNESFRISKLNYYVSNIKLKRTDGTEYIVPQDSSYFLIREDQVESQTVTLNRIPAGDYNAITFTIGVDSLRSTMGISKRTGVLDPAQGHDGMYWTWNSGYIFFKMEGISPAAPTEQENKFYYHIGGFGGYDTPTLNNLRETTITLGADVAAVGVNSTPNVHLKVDLNEFFGGPNPFSIEEYSLVMFSEFSKKVSENYVTMFKYNEVHHEVVSR